MCRLAIWPRRSGARGRRSATLARDQPIPARRLPAADLEGEGALRRVGIDRHYMPADRVGSCGQRPQADLKLGRCALWYLHISEIDPLTRLIGYRDAAERRFKVLGKP